jgi:oligogalacturonide lyase
MPQAGDNMMITHKLFILIPAVVIAVTAAPADAPPREWIDADTGHRVIRLSGDPGSASFYFHQNGYAAGGDKLVSSTRQGLAMG